MRVKLRVYSFMHYAHTNTRTHAHTHTNVRARTHAYVLARAHTHTHTHTTPASPAPPMCSSEQSKRWMVAGSKNSSVVNVFAKSFFF